MPDRILLLPDNIANQIAAGEVIQRPASAVKELLENAVDAGATMIQLIIADAGKSLIQVVDNGTGMSEAARMCFARHATSKIKTIEDLFQIRTMGFRGEALASVAAVGQVELRTKRKEDATGFSLYVENSEIKTQEPVAVPNGTSISLKNLFFNIPARRNFLKSNAAEMRHIIDEFTRGGPIVPSYPFYLDQQRTRGLSPGGRELETKDSTIIGQSIPVEIGYSKRRYRLPHIVGFVGKPDMAKKTRGDQYFFVNNRFIKSGYLHHAIMSAYQEMIPCR